MGDEEKVVMESDAKEFVQAVLPFLPPVIAGLTSGDSSEAWWTRKPAQRR
jgi:hypothetical protein